MLEGVEMNHKAPQLKVGDRVRITKQENVFTKGYTDNWSREIFIIDSMMKTNPWIYRNNLMKNTL